MSFKVYYGDGSVIETDDPNAVSHWDIQVIVQAEPAVGVEVLHYFDYYLYFGSLQRWIGVYGTAPLVEQLAHGAIDILAVGVGRMIEPETFRTILRRANREVYGKKSATHKGEKPQE